MASKRLLCLVLVVCRSVRLHAYTAAGGFPVQPEFLKDNGKDLLQGKERRDIDGYPSFPDFDSSPWKIIIRAAAGDFVSQPLPFGLVVKIYARFGGISDRNQGCPVPVAGHLDR